MVVGLGLSGAGLWILLRPVVYEATVKMEVEHSIVSEAPPPQTQGDYYDPYFVNFMTQELAAVRSDIVLSNVVEALSLSKEWGNRYADGKTLNATETLELLRRHLKLNADRPRAIIEVCVTDEDPDEAAKIANAIANAYCDYRIEKRKEEMLTGAEKLDQDYRKEVASMQARLEKLRKPLQVTDRELQDHILIYRTYNETKQALNKEIADRNWLGAEIERLKHNSGADMKTLQEAYQGEGATVKTLQTKLEDLEKQIIINSNEVPDNVLSNYLSCYEVEEGLNSEQKIQELVKAKIESLKADANNGTFSSNLVTVVSPAVAPKEPVGRPLGAALLLCGLVVSGFGFYSVRVAGKV